MEKGQLLADANGIVYYWQISIAQIFQGTYSSVNIAMCRSFDVRGGADLLTSFILVDSYIIYCYRYLAVTQPLTYSKRRRSKRLALLMIFVVWLVALAITCPPILGW